MLLKNICTLNYRICVNCLAIPSILLWCRLFRQCTDIGFVVVDVSSGGIAEQAMTAWEGHVTDAGAENSLIVKRFTFRCVNSFSRLFYLGFWQRRDTGSASEPSPSLLG